MTSIRYSLLAMLTAVFCHAGFAAQIAISNGSPSSGSFQFNFQSGKFLTCSLPPNNWGVVDTSQYGLSTDPILNVYYGSVRCSPIQDVVGDPQFAVWGFQLPGAFWCNGHGTFGPGTSYPVYYPPVLLTDADKVTPSCSIGNPKNN